MWMLNKLNNASDLDLCLSSTLDHTTASRQKYSESQVHTLVGILSVCWLLADIGRRVPNN